MLMPGATDTDAALAANVIVRASFDSVIPGKDNFVFFHEGSCHTIVICPLEITIE